MMKYMLGAFILVLYYLQKGLVSACLGNVVIPTDPEKQIPTLVEALKVDNGNSRYEGPFPERTQMGLIHEASDLNCKTFEDCAWRNEIGKEGAPNVDEFDFGLASGRPDPIKASQVFATSNAAFPADNNDKWALTGTMQGKDKENEDGALLVSDPVACQLGPGKFSFKYWASPLTQVRVCTRRPNAAKNYIQCQPSPTTPPWYRQYFTHGWPSPGPVEVPIPADPNPFEIVIVANKFNFFVSAAGKTGYGGVVALDDISYQATLCPPRTTTTTTTTTTTATTTNPTTVTLPFNALEADKLNCPMVACSLNDGDFCTEDLLMIDDEWKILEGKYGNPHTGIRESYDGQYALAQGPSAVPVTLTRGPFDLAADRALTFCYYFAYLGAKMSITSVDLDGKLSNLYDSPSLRDLTPYKWNCGQTILKAGSYEKLNFDVDGLTSPYAYFALDEIKLLEYSGGPALC